jgi:pSer/pThr/pTyr-binding forkhead associated (FHA) protein
MRMTISLRVVDGRPHGSRFTFSDGQYLIGRGEECYVRPNSEWVSRQHCLLDVTRFGATIRDLGSRTGTLVNGNRLMGERLLKTGDVVEVGPMVFAIEVARDSLAA